MICFQEPCPSVEDRQGFNFQIVIINHFYVTLCHVNQVCTNNLRN
nr:MAG TPA: hypothetical protein [Bacteriophage sp.]